MPPRIEASMPEPVTIAVPPALALVGMAEQRKPEGIVRTAMIATESDDLIMAVVGDVVLTRYKVTAIGADAVELADLTTGLARRLALQFP
jgi:hypothetical protein